MKAASAAVFIPILNLFFTELIKLSSWFLLLPECQIPSSQNKLVPKRKSSMTTNKFLETSIQTSFHMVGGFWYRRVGHEPEKIWDRIFQE
jgi:hypothetical protein